jgi:hypothetical protein
MSDERREWKAEKNLRGGGCHVTIDGEVVADVFERLANLTHEQSMARAKLFAAATDLLAACKALRKAALDLRGEVIVTGELTAKTLEPMFEADDLAQAAIARAEATTRPATPEEE